MRKLILMAAIFVFAFQTIAFCQSTNPVLTNAVSKLKAELTGHVSEKAYLHFDHPYPLYVAGDVVYFKAYLTMGEKHEPSAISSILHVDLIDKNDLIMQTEAIEIVKGTGWGDFSLPDTLHKGSYRVRAYTDWMRNDPHPYFFDQYISVSSINNVDQVAEAVKQSDKPVLQFFPEGGNIVAELPCKVAFKAVGNNGLAINVKGVILDNDNKEIAKIASGHMGMGAFTFVPDPGKSYKAKLTFADGSQSTLNLPAVEAKGMTLAVNNDDPAKASIEIKANRAYFDENKNKELNLLIYSAGDVRTITTKLDNQVLGLDLAAKDFHTGILQVTLLSQTGEPLNERLSFVQNNDLLNLSLSTNKTTFAKRENVELNLKAKSKEGSPVDGNFSISVVDESKVLVDEDSESTILSYLLLKSELKGYIEKPNYYFVHNTKEARADLDALMLTQGYRRFVWKQVLDNNTTTASTFTPERTVNVAGTLKSKAGAPLANTGITLIEGSGGSVLAQQTDAQGHFNFANMAFYTGVRYILKVQTKATGKNAVVVALDKAVNAPVSAPGNIIEASYNANADILASLQNNSAAGVMTASSEPGNAMLKDNKVGYRTTEKYRSTKLGSGNANQVLHAKDLLNSPSLSLALNGLVHGVYFTGGVPYLQNSTSLSSGGMMNEPMLVVVDGVAASSNVDIYNPNDVETVELLKGPNAGIYGVRGGNGVLVITTKQNNNAEADDSKETAPGLFTIKPVGFYKAREFYAPAYTADQTASALPDMRTTIFWKPDVTTGTDGSASFKFFNADGAGTYRVVVEGIDSKGNLGRQVYRYKVE